MQALSSIGSTLSNGNGFMAGLTNTLNLASGLAQSLAPMFLGQGNPMMGMLSGMPLTMRGLQGMVSGGLGKPADTGMDWGSIIPDMVSSQQGLTPPTFAPSFGPGISGSSGGG